VQAVESTGIEVSRCQLLQEHGSFVRGEPEVDGTQLGQFPARAQPRQWQRWITARTDHHSQLDWEPLQQLPNAFMDERCVDQMIVVENQHDLVGLCRECVDESSDQDCYRQGRRGEQ